MNKVVTHVKAHKEVYIALGVGLSVGVVGTALFKNPQIIQSAVTHGDHSPIIQVAQPYRRGHPGFIVRIKETGEVVASKRRAADILGVHFSKVDDLVDILGEAS